MRITATRVTRYIINTIIPECKHGCFLFVVFVGDANAHHSEWLEWVSLTDRHGNDALDFCNLFGCEQSICYPTHIAGNRFDLVLTDAPDIVDVFVGTPLGTSDHCFVCCLLHGVKVKSSIVRSLPVENLLTLSGVNYQLLAVITEVAQRGTPSCSRPQPATDNGVRDGRSN